jgi:hypothetical protein
MRDLEEATSTLRRQQTNVHKVLNRERLEDLRAINVQIQEENWHLKEKI